MVAVAFDFLFQSLYVQCPRETGQENICIHLQWLDQIVVRTLPHRLDAHADVIYSGDHQENQMGIDLFHLR